MDQHSGLQLFFRRSAVLKGDEAGELGPILENVMAAFAKAGVQVTVRQDDLFQGANSATFVAFHEIFFLRFHGHSPSGAGKYGGRNRPPYFGDLSGGGGLAYLGDFLGLKPVPPENSSSLKLAELANRHRQGGPI